MSAKLITVFGGSGFVGRHTVRALARAGYRIRIGVRRPHTAHFLKTIGDVGQIELVQANIRDDASVARALEGANAAINLVGILYETRRQKFEAVHVDGAVRVAKLAGQGGVRRLVQVSALGCDVHSASKYARTKARAEVHIRHIFPNAIVMRPSILFGPEDQFFNRFANLARISPALPLIGGGHTLFEPVFVGDVASAIANALEDSSANGRTFELGGPSRYTFRELMEFILRETGRARPLIPIPFSMASFMGFFLGLPPRPLLTVDQVRLLRQDNMVTRQDPDIGVLEDLNVKAIAVEAIVPRYLKHFRRHGQFEESRVG